MEQLILEEYIKSQKINIKVDGNVHNVQLSPNFTPTLPYEDLFSSRA